MGLTLVTPATADPVSIAEAQGWARTGGTPADLAALQTMVDAAACAVEEYLGRSLGAQTWRLELEAFADSIELPRGPVTDVESFTYLDADGVETAVADADWVLDLVSYPARIVLAAGASWPAAAIHPAAVRITFTAGYAQLPAALKAEILGLVSRAYDSRTPPTIDDDSRRRLSPWRRILI